MSRKKELAFVGLGEMGLALAARLVEQGFTIHGYDRATEAQQKAGENGVTMHDSLEAAIEACASPRTLWIMVQSDEVEQLINDARVLLKNGDCIIDGGNSFFKESVFRHHDLDGHGIAFIDCGVMGGAREAHDGASLTVGGDEAVVKRQKHIFTALAEEQGFGYVGGPGAGHFVKMVHNGIEYGMLGAIAEGINVLHEHKAGMHLNINEAIKAYGHGSIIESSLITWLADAYTERGKLEKEAKKVTKGETDMDMEYLIDHNRVRVLSAALTQRKLTQIEPSFIGTVIEAIRNAFGESSKASEQNAKRKKRKKG